MFESEKVKILLISVSSFPMFLNELFVYFAIHYKYVFSIHALTNALFLIASIFIQYYWIIRRCIRECCFFHCHCILSESFETFINIASVYGRGFEVRYKVFSPTPLPSIICNYLNLTKELVYDNIHVYSATYLTIFQVHFVPYQNERKICGIFWTCVCHELLIPQFKISEWISRCHIIDE